MNIMSHIYKEEIKLFHAIIPNLPWLKDSRKILPSSYAKLARSVLNHIENEWDAGL